jgi:hypothetical protein
MIKLSGQDRKLIGLLLTPSWISGLVAIVVGLVVSIGVIVVFDANNSLLQQQLLSWQQPQSSVPIQQQTLPQNNNPSIKSTWPLLIVWGLVGLVVYIIVTAIVRSASQAEDLRESLGYVNAKPYAILASTAEHVVFRVLAAVILVSFTLSIWHQVVPYSITAARASDADIVSLDGGLYALLSFALIAVSLHIETVLLRLTMGRARIISSRF